MADLFETTLLFLINSGHIPLGNFQPVPPCVDHIQGIPFSVNYGKIQLDLLTCKTPPLLIQFIYFPLVIVQYKQKTSFCVDFF